MAVHSVFVIVVSHLYEQAEKMKDDATCFELQATTKTFEIDSLETFRLHHVANRNKFISIV